MLQKAPDHTGDMNVLRIAGDAGKDTADAADDELHLDPGTGGRCQLVDDLSLGDGICLDADVSIPAQGNLPVDLLQKHALDAERGDAQLAICSVQLVYQHVAEECRRILTDGGVRRHQTQIRIHGVRFFVVVSRTDLRQVAGFVMAADCDETDLAVAFEALRAVDDLTAGFLQHPGPGEIVFLVKTGAQLHQHQNLFPVFCCAA